MSDWPRGLLADLGLSSISVVSDESDLWDILCGTNPTGGGWPSANLAYYLPFRVSQTFVVSQIGWMNGGTAAGHVDAGIYDVSGARLGSIGSTVQAGVSTLQLAALSLTLKPGYYFMAIAADSTSTTFTRFPAPPALVCRALHFQQQASAFPLPSPATMANPAAGDSLIIPHMAIFGQTVA